MSEINQARKFGMLASIYTYYGYMCNFFLLGAVQDICNLHFITPISPKLIEVGIEIWYADECVGLYT